MLLKIIIMSKSVGFIGGGRITKILLQAFDNKDVRFSSVIVADPNEGAIAKLKEKFPYIREEKPSVVASQDIVFISLHPPVIMETLDEMKNWVRSEATVISLAPKINLAKISLKLNQVKKIVRLIPNATSYINNGFNPVCFSPWFDSEDKNYILDLLKTLGHTFEVEEEKLEGYAIVSAMLPTYFWFQWNYLEEIGVNIGLTKSESEEAVHQTLLAAINLMYTSDLLPGEVMDLIPVRPIGENESQIEDIYKTRLLGLFEKIKP